MGDERNEVMKWIYDINMLGRTDMTSGGTCAYLYT